MRNTKVILVLISTIFIIFISGYFFIFNTSWKMDDFSYKDQNGEPYGKKNLQGKIWIADFIFTNCETVCPPMTLNMAKLQNLVNESHLDIEFVSFSVDPDNDHSSTLLEYGKKFNADFKN